MAFFGIGGGGFGAGFLPGIVPFDTTLLAAATNARLGIGVPDFSRSQSGLNVNIRPPWQLDDGDDGSGRSLATDLNRVRALSRFIDLEDPEVAAADENVDARSTFALFKALEALKTLAQAASERNTAQASLLSLDAKFQQGLSEITSFIDTEELDKLRFLLGSKEDELEFPVLFKPAGNGFLGRTLNVSSVDDAVPGIAGNEVLDLTLTRLGHTETVSVDLSEITGTVSLQAIVDLVNQKIAEVPRRDSNGDLVLDNDGNTVQAFLSKLQIESSDNDTSHRLLVAGGFLEQVSLSTVGGPSLVAASTTSPLIGADADSVTVRRLVNIDTDIVTKSTAEIAGLDEAATELRALVAESEKEDLVEKFGEEFDTSILVDDAETVTAPTQASKVAVDSQGFTYVVGTTQGQAGDFINVAEDNDVFLTKLDSQGVVVFQRLLGTAKDAEAFDLAIDSADNVVITGRTTGALGDEDVFDGEDAFVTKFASNGDRLFTRQLDTLADTVGAALAIDANDNIIVAGTAAGSAGLNLTSSGGDDALIFSVDGVTGEVTGKSLIGTAEGDAGRAVAIAEDGNILLASEENGRAILRKLDAGDLSTEIFRVDLGTIGTGGINDIATDGGAVFVTGTTDNAGFGGATAVNTLNGGEDGFLVRIDDFGGTATPVFTSFLGTAAADTISDVVASGGKVYVAGKTGEQLGADRLGPTDSFIARIDAATGASEEVEQFGESLIRTSSGGLAFSANRGESVLDALGLPFGDLFRADQSETLTQRTTLSDGDHFFISVDGGRARKVTVEDGDDFDDIARKLRLLRLDGVKIALSKSKRGEKISIRAQDDVEVTISPGAEGRDVLKKLGLKPATLLPFDVLLNLADEDGNREDGGVFGLELDGGLNIRDKQTAQFALKKIEDAIAIVQRAFRSLNRSAVQDAVEQRSRLAGAPQSILRRTAEFESALARLQGASFAGPGTNFFV